MTKRAAIYARVSKAYKEDDERVTIENQLADCEEHCRKHGYAVVRRYIDKDKYKVKGALVNPSGTRKDRPGYLAMLKEARDGQFDIIVAWKEDRLYRGMYAALPLSELLDESRSALTVELVTETFDLKMLGIKAAVAKIELDNIRDRMVRGRRTRLERGEVPGGPTRYGYAKQDKHLVIDEAEARIIRQVFEWYIDGQGCMTMRSQLTAMGVPSRGGGRWSKTQLEHIVTFEGYATGEYTTDLDGQSYQIPCPVIIPMHVWERAQETRVKNTAHRSRNVKENYLVRGLVTCPCGVKWHARTVRGAANKKPGYLGKYGYYYCARVGYDPERRDPKCPGKIGSLRVDREVWDFISRLCSYPDVIRQAIDAKIGLLQAEQDEVANEAERLQREMDKIQEERNLVVTWARVGVIMQEDLEFQLAGLHIQAMELRKQYNEAAAASAAKAQAEALKDWAETYLGDVNRGVDVLSKQVAELDQAERSELYQGLDAARFESKFDGDELQALDWAMLEERRRIVRTLISHVLVVRRADGKKEVIPQLVLEVPRNFASLVLNHQSLDYRPWDEDQTLSLSLDVGDQ